MWEFLTLRAANDATAVWEVKLVGGGGAHAASPAFALDSHQAITSAARHALVRPVSGTDDGNSPRFINR